MLRLHRYLLRQMVGPFLFFSLVLTGLIWLSQSLRAVEVVLSSGRSGLALLDMMILLLPRVMLIVLPLAAMAAAVYIYNRLELENEIGAMFAAGISKLSLLWPIVTGGAAVAAVAASISLWLAPACQILLQDRLAHVRSDLAAALIREGVFITKIPGVTAYVSKVGQPGEMLGVFLHDERNPEEVITYTAERALLVEGNRGLRLVLLNGIAQIERPRSDGEPANLLSVLRFDQMDYDLSEASEDPRDRNRKLSELRPDQLVTMTAEEAGDWTLGELRAEGHEAISSPLYVLALPMLAMSIIIHAGLPGRGLNRVIAATGAAMALRIAGVAIKALVVTHATMWPLLYAPPAVGVLLSMWLLRKESMLSVSRRAALTIERH